MMAIEQRQKRAMRAASRGGEDGRSRGRGRGSQVDYYEDLGHSATKEGYGKWKESEDQFASEMKDARSQQREAQGQVNSARSQIDEQYEKFKSQKVDIPGFDEAMSEAWTAAESKLVPVKIVDGNDIQGVYNLPKEAIDNLDPKLPHYYTWLPDGSFAVDVKSKVTGGKRGAELHIAFGEAAQDYKTQWTSAASQKIGQALGTANTKYKTAMAQGEAEFAKERGALADAQAQVDSQGEYMKGIQAQQNANNQKIKDTYQNRLNTLKGVIGGMDIERK